MTAESENVILYVYPHPTVSCPLDKTPCTWQNQEVFRNQCHTPTTGHMYGPFTVFSHLVTGAQGCQRTCPESA